MLGIGNSLVQGILKKAPILNLRWKAVYNHFGYLLDIATEARPNLTDDKEVKV